MTGRNFRAMTGLLMILLGALFAGALIFKAYPFEWPVVLLDGFMFVGGYLMIDPRIAEEFTVILKAWRNKEP